MQKNIKKKKSDRIPNVLFENLIFKKLIQNRTYKFRDFLYSLLDKALGDKSQSHYTYRDWFSSPHKIPMMPEQSYLILSDCLIVAYKRQCNVMVSDFDKINEDYEAQMRVQQRVPE